MNGRAEGEAGQADRRDPQQSAGQKFAGEVPPPFVDAAGDTLVGRSPGAVHRVLPGQWVIT